MQNGDPWIEVFAIQSVEPGQAAALKTTLWSVGQGVKYVWTSCPRNYYTGILAMLQCSDMAKMCSQFNSEVQLNSILIALSSYVQLLI